MAVTTDSRAIEHYFEDLPVPDMIWPEAHIVTREEIIDMAERFEPIEFHLDETAAQEIGAPALVAPSVLIPALVVKLVHQNTPRAAVIGVANQDEVRFLEPVHAGDKLRLRTQLVEKREQDSLPDRGLVRTRFSLINQNDMEVFSTINSVWFRKRNASSSAASDATNLSAGR
ncbi:MaoC/PaaZ C-terminal domain-containing protein [Parasphingorhabdus sp.]|uniref:MaoC/PaaZ C-terminal domain-containing protein n=1 Tax=Parasphingorhabdus sp. TaxID=2709688 RepID=UPI003A8F8277